MLLEFQGVMNSSTSTLGEANALKCELAAEVLRSSGSLRLCVTGWSMLPTVWPGDTLVIERMSIDAASDGEIVLFGRDRRLFAHRVVAKREPQNAAILTRGDAMPASDAPVPESDVLGRVSLIVRNGKCIEPSRRMHFSKRAVAAVLRRSSFAARVVVGVRGMLQMLHGPSSDTTSQVQASQIRTASI
jgi:signal peptidase I